ncbi:MAG: aminotransferase class I/II-fold pyridoxal phosphate-dependent enzyme [Candidatus Cyclonatronum sp.]|uniref:aminotransferase class I/II-fold pyridoxal phosphate-dependent enzyme n=1 Tax=Cyclonatronum sp. TaxID=3024185 RepID=UPI0025BC5A50|nr:aminotransferase class I/II-fold pyridoxal phosphate-dependent enzyme [Cyclonatronum sp.]MCH8486677.1 aminotransferase class I/II-fold pyridoxal phosphate-dependent enzyme [Cyclonatronum sp.]
MYISKRGTRILDNNQPLVAAHYRCASDPWHPQSNPKGYINFGTAENHLVFDLLQKKLNAKPGIDEHHTHYAELHGMKHFREALAGYLNEYTGIQAAADQIVTAAGSSAILDMVMFGLCEPGEGMILPAPYYAGFDHDLKTRVQVEAIPAYTRPEDGYSLTLEVLQQALLHAGKRTIKVRGIIITNPHNPLGKTYDSETLQMIVNFAADHKLQIVADELYMNSVFGDKPFVSLAKIAADAGIDVHLVYGFAKDFGLSGFKTGLLYTKSEKLLQVVKELAYFMPVSNATQQILTNLLTSGAFLKRFIAENKLRLKNASATLHRLLAEADFPAERTDAGFFAWVDLSKWLDSDTFENEMQLYNYVLEQARVNIMPGQFFHNPEPGWYRLCYARNEEMLTEGIRRIKSALQALDDAKAATNNDEDEEARVIQPGGGI